MSRYNTQNPIESDDVRDMSDNAKNLDLFSNSSELSFDDRLGVERKTVHGMNDQFDVNLASMNSEFDVNLASMNSEFDVNLASMNSEFDANIASMNSEFDAQILNMGFARVGTFTAGATLTNPRQTLLWGAANGGDGQEYGWSGAFPKIVPPSSTPSSTGGISVGAWLSRFDPELRIIVREAMRRSYAEAGFNLVAGSFEAGGTLVNANDVLLQERTGKAFSGPAGTVAAGTNPASGGFVDKSGGLLRHELATSNGATKVGTSDGGSVQDFIDAQTFANVAAMLAYTGLTVGQKCSTGGTTWKYLGGDSTIITNFAALTPVNVKDFGAVGDGVTDDTQAFVEAALLGVPVLVTKSSGNYIVTHSNIVCVNGTEFFGDGVLQDLSVPIVSANSPNFGFIRVTKNNKISGLKFVGDDNRLFAVTGISSAAVGTVENITVEDVTTESCGIFICEPEKGFTFNRIDEPFVSWILSGPVTSDNISKNIVVKNCTMYGDTFYNPTSGNCNSSQAHGVAFVYAEDCLSINNTVRNARFGNWSFGGGVYKSDGFSVSGAPRLNRNVVFSGGIAKDTYSGFWMSRTVNGTMTGTITERFEDVTIDFEGCENCTATGNVTYASGVGGGSLTALVDNDSIVFANNTCHVTGTGTISMVNTFAANTGIVYDGNIFNSTAAVTPSVIIIRNRASAVSTLCPTPSTDISFINNKIFNCRVLIEDITSGLIVSGNTIKTPVNTDAVRIFNCPDFYYTGNSLTLTVDSSVSGQSSSPVQFILGGAGLVFTGVDISRNVIRGTLTETGITVFGAQSPTCVARIEDNSVNAIFLDNSWIFSVANQNRGRVVLTKNVSSFSVDTSHVGASVLKSISGAELSNPFETSSNAPPTTGAWKRGDIVKIALPTAGGKIGWVCTASGTPGTWKQFGVIDV